MAVNADNSIEQRLLPDGRVELAPAVDELLEKSGLHNEDLAPVPIEKRTWTTYNFAALWVGMAHQRADLAARRRPHGSAWTGTRSSSRYSWPTSSS